MKFSYVCVYHLLLLESLGVHLDYRDKAKENSGHHFHLKTFLFVTKDFFCLFPRNSPSGFQRQCSKTVSPNACQQKSAYTKQWATAFHKTPQREGQQQEGHRSHSDAGTSTEDPEGPFDLHAPLISCCN